MLSQSTPHEYCRVNKFTKMEQVLALKVSFESPYKYSRSVLYAYS